MSDDDIRQVEQWGADVAARYLACRASGTGPTLATLAEREAEHARATGAVVSGSTIQLVALIWVGQWAREAIKDGADAVAVASVLPLG